MAAATPFLLLLLTFTFVSTVVLNADGANYNYNYNNNAKKKNAGGCYTDSNGVQRCRSVALPPGACLWRQGILQYNVSTGASRPDCIFQVAHPNFLRILGRKPKLEFLAFADAHEGGVYFPDTEDFYFSSTRKTKPSHSINLAKLSLVTKKVTTIWDTTPMSNGMVLDHSGNLIVCQQGLGEQGGFIERMNLKTNQTSIVADNWFGIPFNSPNDVVVKSDGSIWFTDPNYGWVQGFKKNEPRVNNQVYKINKWGVVEVVADGFIKPNGLAFSANENVLYVTDTGSSTGTHQMDVSLPHSVYSFDIDPITHRLFNRRLFASISSLDGSYYGVGAPDGIKVDTHNNVYVANLDGIQVFNPNGELLGLIQVPGATNMGFVGKNRDHLLILNDTSIQSIRLNTHGANLFYIEKYFQ